MPTNQGFRPAPRPDTSDEMMIWIQDPRNTAEEDKNPGVRELNRGIREIALASGIDDATRRAGAARRAAMRIAAAKEDAAEYDAAKRKIRAELKAAAREEQRMLERFEASHSIPWPGKRHICRVCQQPRSPRYHLEHPIPKGSPAPPGEVCKRCRQRSERQGN